DADRVDQTDHFGIAGRFVLRAHERAKRGIRNVLAARAADEAHRAGSQDASDYRLLCRRFHHNRPLTLVSPDAITIPSVQLFPVRSSAVPPAAMPHSLRLKFFRKLDGLLVAPELNLDQVFELCSL